MAVIAYQGEYVNADSAHDYIDVNSICEGIKSLQDASNKLVQLNMEINILKEKCSKIKDKKTNISYDKLIYCAIRDIGSTARYINNVSLESLYAVKEAFNCKQVSLNKIAKKLDLEQQESNNG